MKKVPTPFIWFDGSLKKQSASSVSILNHGLHYGSAVFEGIRCYATPSGPAVFRLKEHVDRLFHSAAVMHMKVPYTKKVLTQAILDTIKKNALNECYIRPIIFYEEHMGLLPTGSRVHVAIAVWPWKKYLESKTTKVHIVSTRRIHPDSGVMTAKISGQYYNSIIASLEAQKAQADEALLLDYKGYIAEGPGENIFFVRGTTLYTPKDTCILPGITRDTIKTMAVERGLRVVEKNISAMQLETFDEAFFVGTAVEVHPIAQINKKRFTSIRKDSLSHAIQAAYFSMVRGGDKKYSKWLTLAR